MINYADREVLERHNFRQYMEHQGTTRVGIGHAAPFSGKLEDYAYPEEKIKEAMKNLPRV